MTRQKAIENEEKARNIATALAGIEEGTYISVRKATIATGAPRSTLRDRIKGVPTRRQSNEHRQRLTPEEESILVRCVEQLSCTGNPVHHSFLRELAEEIRKPHVERDGYHHGKLGKNWVSRFLARNPALQSKVAKNIEVARKEVTEAQLVNWFTAFNRVVKDYGILRENIYNMDETGPAIEYCITDMF